MGLEGLVSKHRERAYRAGRCDHWRKIKNPAHPGNSRVQAAHGARGKKYLKSLEIRYSRHLTDTRGVSY
jgi:ATP-dependent DNA ligase